jgi:hypothetical protein
MVSGEDSQGLRHKPRHGAGGARSVPDGMDIFELKLIAWGVPAGHPAVNAIRFRLSKVWLRLSDLERACMLKAAKDIMSAQTRRSGHDGREPRGEFARRGARQLESPMTGRKRERRARVPRSRFAAVAASARAAGSANVEPGGSRRR